MLSPCPVHGCAGDIVICDCVPEPVYETLKTKSETCDATLDGCVGARERHPAIPVVTAARGGVRRRERGARTALRLAEKHGRPPARSCDAYTTAANELRV